MLTKRPIIALLVAIFHLCIVGDIFSQNLIINLDIEFSDPVRVNVSNNGDVVLNATGIEYYINGIIKTDNTPFRVAPGKTKSVPIDITRPIVPGSYNIWAKIKYTLDGKPATLISNFFVPVNQAAVIDVWVDVKTTAIERDGTITLTFKDPTPIALCTPVFPDELVITDRRVEGNSIIYTVKNTRPDLSEHTVLLWTFEKEEAIPAAEGTMRIHRAGWLRVSVTLGRGSQPYQVEIGRKPQYIDRNFIFYNFLSTNVVAILTVIAVFFFILMVIVYRGKETLIPLMYVSFAFVLVNVLILIFQIPFVTNPTIPFPIFNFSEPYVRIQHIPLFVTASNYVYFRNFVLPVYYPIMIFYLVYSYLDIKKRKGEDLWNRLQEKKIWRIFAFLYARIRKLFHKTYDKRDYAWNPYRRTAFLAIGVKFLWMPLLWTWTINNIFVMIEQIMNMQPDFYRVNEFAVNLIILMDVAIFAFSYTVESKKTNSMIKSVEPTVIGWLVCIACYPPLNQFSFQWVDNLFAWVPNFELSEPVKIAAFVGVTVCWAFYASATVALGFKSSNLTNRGIVTRFPYNIVRHPAYIGKNLLWVIEFFLLSQKHLGLVVGFIVVYFFRAITEERHLKKDPDYVAYMKKVKYKFIPGII
ncbi:MAG: hypothetical protein JXD23_04065 [Spirochaetales bacterium]|nr:hypothetical protein [Spirochaetales bacterium]